MRILLIATNRHDRVMSRMRAQPIPIGLAYIAGHLDRSRHTVQLLDLMFASDHYLDEVAAAVQDFNPHLVGISIRNLSNHSYLDPQWQLPITKSVIDRIRSLSPATIVCGGPAFSIMPEPVFNFVQPDLGVAGDAGETFAELANRLEIGEPDYHDLTGLIYRAPGNKDDNGADGALIYNGMRCASDFASRPSLDDLDMSKYAQAGFGVSVLTKLGGFYYPTSADDIRTPEGAWRVIRPVDEVVDEVSEVTQRYNLRKIFFVDNCFNVPLEHAKSLCHALIDAPVQVRWNTCLAPYACDAELIGLMKRAGCGLVMMGGTRGGDPHEGDNDTARYAALKETTDLCEAGDLHYTISQQFGEPGETRASVENKLDFLRGLKPALANLRVGVSVMPGTEVAARCLAEGIIADETELVAPTFYLAEEVRPWLVDYLRQQTETNPRWNLM